MDKIKMGPQSLIYPQPVFIVGANVDGKANFMTVAAAGAANGDPPMISIAIMHHRYTLVGIRQNMSFSINIPSMEFISEADFCGTTSGRTVDKAEVCKFDIFYGVLENAPLIKQFPVNLECKALHIMNLGSHSFIIGQIVESYITEDCLTDKKPDIDKIKPFWYTTRLDRRYRSTGEIIGKASEMGRQLKAL